MLGSCCSGQFDEIFEQVLIMTPFAEKLVKAAEKRESRPKEFLDAVLNYCANLCDVLGDGNVTEKHNDDLMRMYDAYTREAASQSDMIQSAAAYCQARMSAETALPAQCWPALLSSATVKPKGPNPLTRAQTMEKGEEKMIRLEQKRYSNLEIEGCKLMILFRREDVAAKIKEKRFELRFKDDGEAYVCAKDK